jgi:hypothetical protein
VVGPLFWESKFVPHHTFGPSWVKLSLGVPPRDTHSSYTCVITTPDGTSWIKTIPPPLLRGVPWTHSTVFPDEFPGSSPLAAGPYRVEWRRGSVSDAPQTGTSRLAAALAQKMTLQRLQLVASDAFTIPGATPGQQDAPRTTETEKAQPPTDSTDKHENPEPPRSAETS